MFDTAKRRTVYDNPHVASMRDAERDLLARHDYERDKLKRRHGQEFDAAKKMPPEARIR